MKLQSAEYFKLQTASNSLIMVTRDNKMAPSMHLLTQILFDCGFMAISKCNIDSGTSGFSCLDTAIKQ